MCMYVYVCVYMCIYIHTHTHTPLMLTSMINNRCYLLDVVDDLLEREVGEVPAEGVGDVVVDEEDGVVEEGHEEGSEHGAKGAELVVVVEVLGREDAHEDGNDQVVELHDEAQEVDVHHGDGRVQVDVA